MFVPGLVEFIPNPKIQGEPGSYFVIVLEIACRPPLAIADETKGRRELNIRNQAKDEVCRAPARPARRARELTVVTELTQKSDVSRIYVVLLVSRGLSADREVMPAPLPSQIVVVVEGIVGKDLRIRICAQDNLSRSAGLSARRLLLLTPERTTKHVVAEVLVDGRWIIVDPTYRTILRDAQGHTLTRKDLQNPAIFAQATGSHPWLSSQL